MEGARRKKEEGWRKEFSGDFGDLQLSGIDFWLDEFEDEDDRHVYRGNTPRGP